METKFEDLAPHARRKELIIREIDGEVLLYDLNKDKSLCLNGPAAAVWRHCDGQKSIAQIKALASEELGAPVDDQIIYAALEELNTGGLLYEAVTQPRGISRRQMLIGSVAAAATIPIITTLAGPKAAFADACASTPTCGSGPNNGQQLCVTSGGCLAPNTPACSGYCCCGNPGGRAGCVANNTCGICSYGGCQLNSVPYPGTDPCPGACLS